MRCPMRRPARHPILAPGSAAGETAARQVVSLNCLLIVLGDGLFLYSLSSCLPADYQHLVRGHVLLLLHRAIRPANLDPIRPGLLLPTGRGPKAGGPGGGREQRHRDVVLAVM